MSLFGSSTYLVTLDTSDLIIASMFVLVTALHCFKSFIVYVCHYSIASTDFDYFQLSSFIVSMRVHSS